MAETRRCFFYWLLTTVYCLLAFLEVPLPGAYARVGAGGGGDLDAEELAGRGLVVREALKQVLRTQLGGDLAEDGFEPVLDLGDEGAAAGRAGDHLHPLLRARGAHVKVHGVAARVDRVEDGVGALHLAQDLLLRFADQVELLLPAVHERGAHD